MRNALALRALSLIVLALCLFLPGDHSAFADGKTGRASAASTGDPKEGDLQFADLGDFRLESGQVIRHCRIGYHTYGKLNTDRSNAVLFPVWFTGTAADLAGQAGPGGMVDARKYFLITIDPLGDGVSSSPSNGAEGQKGAAFPVFSIRDMVETQHRVLTDVLHLSHIHAVMGISMGGMQALQWSVAYPDYMDQVISIVGSPRLTSYDLLLWKSQLRLIESAGGTPEGERVARIGLADLMLTHLKTPAYYLAHTQPADVDKVLADEDKEIQRHDLQDWASQLRAMIRQDIYQPFGESVEKAAGAVKARMLFVISESDHMVNPTAAREFAQAVKSARLITVSDVAGHQAGGDKFAADVIRFLGEKP